MARRPRSKDDQPGNEVYDWGEAFLAGVMEGKSPSRAAVEAGVSRQAPYERKWAHKDFAEAWERALQVRRELLEEAAFQRAVRGVIVSTNWEFDPNTGERVKMGEVRKFSDGLMALLLKKEMPEYRDRLQVDATVSGDVHHVHSIAVLGGKQPVEFSPALRRQLAAEMLEHDQRTVETGDVIEGDGRSV